ncbi:carbamoyltransferase family protein [Janthinobacterium agaricidamnosum]|uniref:Carbamoyltransferase family protein n=1 Tax=Janthinobacterium agaricidamnosum NBRC 102515 = DSM 9628 TaxID=1349767 RepID=W0V6A6_9BURK|nr:carbamoyltransferase [Janthinobacterium agaricidamnosum]CDG83130.1 carbamoyltransferase family protein [Janthinobacterium agaricidamnosum NBRC 102515 = DSM 9628]
MLKKTYLLGLSYGYHDAAAVLLCDGEIVAAAQEERFTRIKQDPAFPENALRYCLAEGAIALTDLAGVYYYENPHKKLNRLVSTYLSYGLRGYRSFVAEMPAWLTRKVHVRSDLRRKLQSLAGRPDWQPVIKYVDHHASHAAAAFLASPYDEAAVLCIDGVGEWATTTAWTGVQNTLTPVWEIRFPHSLGLLYSAVTYFCGFKVDSGEYKVMGLAPYGKPVYADTIRQHLIDIKPDGSFWLDMAYFDFAVGDCMVTDKFSDLFGGPRREPESRLTQREFDLAASVQVVLEDVLCRLARTLRERTGQRRLCMAGGVALNCVANGKLLQEGIFDEIWVQPASGDSGGALGAALYGWHQHCAKARRASDTDRMQASLLGTAYSNAEIGIALQAHGAVATQLEGDALYAETARLLAEGKVIGWFQGRMEFGPRSLGARSILGDARNTTMQSIMNLKIKNRESFRPFAPAVLEEHVSEWFDLDRASPYMLFVVDVNRSKWTAQAAHASTLTGIELLKCQRSQIPAVTHVDYSARVQTVSAQSNPAFRQLLLHFHRQTGCPLLVNTSFNVRGEPIVESPANAYACFMRTEMDYLVIGNYVLNKADQPAFAETGDWRELFALD